MSNFRRCIWIGVVLLFAGTVSWWSARNEASIANHVQAAVSKLVPEFAENPKSLRGIVLDPILEPMLASTLQEVLDCSVAQNELVVVIVRGGDSVLFGDGSATHVALLEVDHQIVGGLRIVCSSQNEPLIIAGVFSGGEY